MLWAGNYYMTSRLLSVVATFSLTPSQQAAPEGLVRAPERKGTTASERPEL